MKQIILISRAEAKSASEEEQNRFIFSVLESMGVDLSDIEIDEDCSFSVSEKIKLRQLLDKLNIKIVSENDETTIYAEDQKVGKWLKPEFFLKKDLSAVDKQSRYYLEMHTNTWRITDG